MNLFISFIYYLVEAIYYAVVHKDPGAQGCLLVFGGVVIFFMICIQIGV